MLGFLTPSIAKWIALGLGAMALAGLFVAYDARGTKVERLETQVKTLKADLITERGNVKLRDETLAELDKHNSQLSFDLEKLCPLLEKLNADDNKDPVGGVLDGLDPDGM